MFLTEFNPKLRESKNSRFHLKIYTSKIRHHKYIQKLIVPNLKTLQQLIYIHINRRDVNANYRMSSGMRRRVHLV
jgi:hypothetical protein